MFYYKIYGKIIYINIKMPLLTDLVHSSTYDIQVKVNYVNVVGDDIYIKEQLNQYDVKLGELALYHICPEKDIIVCMATNFESFFSTFLTFLFPFIF